MRTKGPLRQVFAAVLTAWIASKAASAEGPTFLEETDLRIDAALRATLVQESPPYGDDAFSSFFDQYRYVATENEPLPWHLDFRKLRIAWEREDGTRPLEIERESRGWLNERGRIDLRFPRLEAEIDYSRFRTDELRLFPVGTEASIPVFGTQYNSDLRPDDPLGEGRRLFSRRNRIGGALAMARPESLRGTASLVESRLFVDYEERAGRRQDRFLVESNLALADTDRFRGRRRDLDQESLTIGGEAAAVIAERFTTEFDLRFEGFRERASAFTYGRLAADVPSIAPSGNPAVDERAFRYVPDTNRIVARFSSAGRVGRVHLRLASHFSHLRQAGAGSPVQRENGIEENVVNEGSLRAAWRMPLGRRLTLSGRFSARWRENRVGRDAIERSTLFYVQEQTNAYIKHRREYNVDTELRYRPRSGTSAVVGFRSRNVDRHRAFGFGFTSIPDEYNLIDQTSRNLLFYVEAGQRLGRASRVSFEAGYEWSPEVALVREAQEAYYARSKWTASFSLPRPLTVSLQGGFRRRANDDIELSSPTPGGSRRKEFSQIEWNYGSVATWLAPRDVQVVAAFFHARDLQRFDHVRSNLPRNAGLPFLAFFRDSTPELCSDVKSLAMSARAPVFDGLEARFASSVTWVDAGYRGGGDTGRILDDTNRIRDRILGLETGLIWSSGPWSAELAYRYDDFDDRTDLSPLERDVSVHTGWLQIAYRL